MNNPLVQPDPGLYIWTIVTFLLLAALDERQQAIRQSLDDARQAKQDLERVHAESAKILEQARKEAESIVASTRTDVNQFREEMRLKAREEAAGIVKNAERQIELETARALQQIRHEAVDLSVTIASKLLQRNVSKDDNARLIEDTFKQIEASGRPS